MANRRVRKIRSQVIKLALFSGAEVLFVAERPDDRVGEGAIILMGSDPETPMLDAARRILNELKHHFKNAGLDLDYRVKEIKERATKK